MAAAGLIACAVGALLFPGSISESNERLIDVFVYMGVGAVALAACLLRVFKVEVERTVWIAIAIAIGAWLIGTAITSVSHSHSESGHNHAESAAPAVAPAAVPTIARRSHDESLAHDESLPHDESVPHEEPETSKQPVAQRREIADRQTAPESTPAPHVDAHVESEAPAASGWRDFFYLAFLVAGAVGLGALVRARMKPFQPTILLDGAIVALAATAVGSTVADALIAGSGGQASLLQVLMPLTSLAALVFLIWTVAMLGREAARRWLWPIGALALAAIASAADVAQVVSGGGHELPLIEALWPAAILLFAASAWQQPQTPIQPNLEGRGKTLAVSLAASVALTLMALSYVVGLGALTLALAVVTLSLLIARASVAFRENREMVDGFQHQAQTDFLTSLGNRRKLMLDLQREIAAATGRSPCVLLLLDLDGFKSYNDTFGHPAGDALLQRLGANLERVIEPYGCGYRLGGDEFCALVTGNHDVEAINELVANALSEEGEGFSVTSSGGSVLMPHEARDASAALRIADQRMYARKESRRNSSSRQTRDILIQVLREREPDLDEHVRDVATLAKAVGARVGLVGEALDEVVRAAELHDIGKMAIPDEILHKPASLDDREWAFMKQHTIVGERILQAAPALSPVAKLVRASHERWDGTGYPDRVLGDRIPLGARIVAACDAFDAMTSERPYCSAMPVEAALTELRAHAGRQFDPAIVDAVCIEIEIRRIDHNAPIAA